MTRFRVTYQIISLRNTQWKISLPAPNRKLLEHWEVNRDNFEAIKSVTHRFLLQQNG